MPCNVFPCCACTYRAKPKDLRSTLFFKFTAAALKFRSLMPLIYGFEVCLQNMWSKTFISIFLDNIVPCHFMYLHIQGGPFLIIFSESVPVAKLLHVLCRHFARHIIFEISFSYRTPKVI